VRRFDFDCQAAEAFVDFGDLLALPDELFGVGHVLVLATTAFAEEFATGLDAGGGRDNHSDEVAAREVSGVMPDAGDDLFAWEGPRDEDDPTVDPAEAVAEIGDGRNVDFHLLVVGELALAELGGVGLSALRCIDGFFFGHVSKLGCPPGRSSLIPAPLAS
jgi:hypothetical protein